MAHLRRKEKAIVLVGCNNNCPTPWNSGSGLNLIKRLVYVSGGSPPGGILFCVFLFLLLLALFLQALSRLFLLAFLCYKSLCHGFNIKIISKLPLRLSDRHDYFKIKLKELKLQSLLIKN